MSQLMGIIDSLKMLTTLFMSLRFPSLFLILVSLVVSVSATNSIYTDCSKFCFDSMTPYEANLNSLFTSIIDSSSISNFKKFQISQNDVLVYGLFQCQGDLSSSKCNDCVTNSINQLKTTCPMSIGGTVQLDGCFVKYDDSSFFGTQNKTEAFRTCGLSIGYNSDILNRIDEALTSLTSENEQYFRRGTFGSLQGVAQCVQDLSISDCQDCLSEACGRLRTECVTSTSADMFLGKCYLRYGDQVAVGCHYCSSSSDKSCCAHESSSLDKGCCAHEGSSSDKGCCVHERPSSDKDCCAHDGSNSDKSCCGNTYKILMWIAIIVGIFVAGVGVTYILRAAIKNECTNVFCCIQLLKLRKDVQTTSKKVKELADAKDKDKCPNARSPCNCPSPYPTCYPSYPLSYHPPCNTQICVTDNQNGCVLM